MEKELLDQPLGGHITIRKRLLVGVEVVILIANFVACIPMGYIMLEAQLKSEWMLVLFYACIIAMTLLPPIIYLFEWRKSTQAFDLDQNATVLEQEVLKPNVFFDLIRFLFGFGGLISLILLYDSIQPETGLGIGFALIGLFFILGPIQLVFFIYIYRLRKHIIRLKLH
jgi:hypothetical protein